MKILLWGLIFICVAVTAGAYGIASYLTPDEPPPRIAAPSTLRVVDDGALIGLQGGLNTHAWLGIPYASPPVGHLRWRAPQHVIPWEGRREVIEFAPRCPQLPVLPLPDAVPLGDEDCLYLNVWAPPFHPERVPEGDDRLPVMVWIHGGGNSLGGADLPLYDGARYASEHEVIVVSLNYRLGPLGWFRHETLRESNQSGAENSGNFGTLDIIAALRWVQHNVTRFGGDPGRVTLFGESAGGSNILSLMASSMAVGLFHGAIVQSGYFKLADPVIAENLVDAPESGDPYSSSEVIVKLMRADGLAADRQTAKDRLLSMSTADLARYLRSKTIRELFAAYEVNVGGMLQMPLLFADGEVLPAATGPELFDSEDGYHPVPVILGSNRDEMKLFLSIDPRMVRSRFQIPLEITDPDAYERANRYGSDAFRAITVDQLATRLRRVQGPSVWTYRFDVDDWRNLGFIDLKALLGASHFIEVPFVFGHFPRPGRVVFTPSMQEEYDVLSESMMSYWAEFAYSGAPGSGREGNGVHWTAWENDGAATERTIVFDTESDGGVRMTSDRLGMAAIKRRFRNDTTFASDDEKCAAYRTLFREAFDATEYATLVPSGCRTDSGMVTIRIP